eukprot:TRINITY_DN26166_c0_g1_i2.p2 TRINITY_DN26166_c0_g1~~TRINITY_DN26166_c0_g1_i2.p2  ORF type:complete len:105 (+),score=33.24 TRINITY_DN26166_c0_g1_i2:287-601(+)
MLAESKIDVNELSDSLRKTREELHAVRSALSSSKEENAANMLSATKHIAALTDELNATVRTAIDYETQLQHAQAQAKPTPPPLHARRTPAPGSPVYSPLRTTEF